MSPHQTLRQILVATAKGMGNYSRLTQEFQFRNRSNVAQLNWLAVLECLTALSEICVHRTAISVTMWNCVVGGLASDLEVCWQCWDKVVVTALAEHHIPVVGMTYISLTYLNQFSVFTSVHFWTTTSRWLPINTISQAALLRGSAALL